MLASAVDAELIQDLASFSADPLGCALYSFPWGEAGELEEYEGPRDWQADVLESIGKHLQSEETRHVPLQIAVASGHGIGKSALVGQIVHWAMSTCDDTRVIITSNTGDQLRTKTIPEVSKWFRLSWNAHWWRVGTESIKIKGQKHEKTWRTDFLTWSLERTEAFAGLHNKGKRIVFIFDEASAIPDKIWEVAEGALTDEDTEIIWLVFGNPTMNTGRFRECFGRYKHRWITKQIDSRKVQGTNKQQIGQWVADYGEDSDFVRVRVRGEFPRAGSTQFISSELVSEARKNELDWVETQPKIISVDVARFGDDQTIIGFRQGMKYETLAKLRGLDTVQVAHRVMEQIVNLKPDGIVVDGDGLGAGVVDILRSNGHGKKLREFHGGSKPHDGDMYFNHRAEAWGLMKKWLESGADIPDDPELESDLTGPEYFFSNKNQIQLEKKDDMKSRGLSSPDCGDCLAMSFAFRVEIRTTFEERLSKALDEAPNSTVAHMVHMKMLSQRKGKTRFTGR